MHALLLLALATAPVQASPDSLDFRIWNHGRPAGEMRVVSEADSVQVYYRYVDRQRGPLVEASYRMDGGRPVHAHLRRGGAQAQSADITGAPVPLRSSWFEIRDGAVHTWTEADTTSTPLPTGGWYLPRITTPLDNAVFAAYLLSRPDGSAPTLPAGRARATVAADTTVIADGEPVRVRMVAVEGVGPGVSTVWLDESDRLFATGAGWFITVRKGAEEVLPGLRGHELRYLAERDAALAERFAPAPSPALVLRNGDLFDSETGLVRPRTTVVVEGERIAAVGPTDSVPVPRGATVIDVTGKTILPGLWDMHTHAFQGSDAGLLQLAAGITTIRDLASDIDVVTSLRDRADRGEILSPRFVLGGFIEGPGLWAGPSRVLVRNEEEARAWVARYDSLGYQQIKLYNLVHPDLIPTIAAEAKARGMRLSGHIPRGLTLQSAVTLGYDEVQHIAFLVSTFHQDSLYVPRMRAYSQVASTVIPTFDVDAPEVTALLGFLRESGTVVDGTFNIWQDRLRLLDDGTDPVFGPTIDWLPPVMQRRLRAGSGGSSEAVARAQASSANYRRLLKRLFDAGVTLVPGTDNVAGLSFHGELEIYERSGIPAPNVLQIATLTSARVMGMEDDYGSVAVGKVADLAIVDGRPAERITELRKTEFVVRAGRLYRSRALYEALGITPRPRASAPASSTGAG